MKKNVLKTLLALITVFSVIFVGCASEGTGDDNGKTPSPEVQKEYFTDPNLAPVADGYLRINTLSTNADNLWIWNDFDPSETVHCVSWGDADGGFKITGKNGDFVYADIKMLDSPQQVGFIVREGTTKLSGSSDVIYVFPGKYNEIFLKNGSGKIYIDKNCTIEPSGLASALITAENTITPTIKGIKLDTENLKVFESDGITEISVTSVTNTSITVNSNLKDKGTVYVQYTDEKGTDKRIANFSSSLIDEWFTVDDVSSFGYKNGVFKTWAPFASTAKVLLFEDASKTTGSTYKVAKTIDMTRNSDGTWQTADVSSEVGSNKYYKYSFMNNNVQYDVCDIWAKSAAKNSTASAIEEISANNYEASYTNPFGNSGAEVKRYSDAVIYEMHITDWSQAFRPTMMKKTPGTFKEIANAVKTGGFGDYLKDLGVTHVQILPMFEYAVTSVGTYNEATGSVDFAEDDNAYNWGYNPYNWNTPESRYVQNMENGSDATDQMREMISAFHEKGIAVIMDVVYNHTAGTGNGSIYDMTAPKYFYRMDSQGNYSNGSGCGNEVATNHAMVKNYVIDSLKHWMKNYHINGFRFDLMGLHETSTMKEIYEALYEIDPNVMVYGEPWAGGTSQVQKGCSTSNINDASPDGTVNGVGCFDDSYRNAIKGPEFGGFNFGEVQGVFAKSEDGQLDSISMGLSGSKEKVDVIGRFLNYVECHDNFTLFDKLSSSLVAGIQGTDDDNASAVNVWKSYDKMNDTEKRLVKSQQKLAGAFVILAQGTPFINGGQEFCRSKQGNPDSYAADKKGGKFWENIDECNAIDFSMKDSDSNFYDVYLTYRGLLKLRTDNRDSFGNNDSVVISKTNGNTKYTVDDFEIYFNSSNVDWNLSNVSGKVISLDSSEKTEKGYTIADTETTVSSVPAKSFVILKK